VPPAKVMYYSRSVMYLSQRAGLGAVKSALPPKADIERHDWHVRFVPQAVISRSLFNHLVDLRKQRR
jgi:hypothetical protein